MTEPVVLGGGGRQNIEKGKAILVRAEDILPGIAASGNVIQGAGVFNSQRTCHVDRIASILQYFKN